MIGRTGERVWCCYLPAQQGRVVFVMLPGEIEQPLDEGNEEQHEQHHEQCLDDDEQHKAEGIGRVPPVRGRFDHHVVHERRRGGAQDGQKPAQPNAARDTGGQVGGGNQFAARAVQLRRHQDGDGDQGRGAQQQKTGQQCHHQGVPFLER